MDDFMQAEGSVDEGGPTREFFRLLMMALKDSTLFTGPQNSKNLSLDSHGWYPHMAHICFSLNMLSYISLVVFFVCIALFNFICSLQTC